MGVQMRRTDRLFGMMLRLRSGRVVTATELAAAFEVSQRTVYRDMETLSALGVPVYAEQGRGGGYRLLEGYFLPAISFSQEEAVSLLLGLAVLERMRSRPFAAHLETAQAKLLAAMPTHLSDRLARSRNYLGVERSAEDAFHRELAEPALPEQPTEQEQRAIDTFLRALLDGMTVRLTYRSPYRPTTDDVTAIPHGLFWDRDRWYLVGDRLDPSSGRRLWRADRVQAIRAHDRRAADDGAFDIQPMLGRAWLAGAMAQWAQESPVRIRLSPRQADLLQRDWYYQHAQFEPCPTGEVIVRFGQDRVEAVMELLRWLGPGAELLEPAEWRAILVDDLQEMLRIYQETPQASQ
jgi:predicted DNA-binding transcriptional regulator YafY